jgi:GrpB-like predicted nucleotidyltransferase (UPF0157 family)
MKQGVNPEAGTRRVIRIEAHDAGWRAMFLLEQANIAHALGGTLIAAHHIGSTAVPGLAAKPIIDILLEVRGFDLLDAQSDSLAALGYAARGENGIAGRRYFQKGGARRTHHLHAYVHGDPNVTRHLALRDYLVANEVLAREYAALKRQLALRHRLDPAAYQAGKDAFLHRHEAAALAWWPRDRSRGV